MLLLVFIELLGKGPLTTDEPVPVNGLITIRICCVPEISVKPAILRLKDAVALVLASEKVGAFAARMQLSRQAK